MGGGGGGFRNVGEISEEEGRKYFKALLLRDTEKGLKKRGKKGYQLEHKRAGFQTP